MKTVVVNEIYQRGYTYTLTSHEGRDFAPEFSPDLTPEEMLKAGVFGGNYFRTPPDEFPHSWFEGVRIAATDRADPALNCFGVNASQPLVVWQKKGWIHPEDPRGWFLWYCRYFRGRRIGAEDQRQMRRWRAIRRHVSQIEKNCNRGDWTCRPRQRQAVLHWAYDSRKL